MPTASPGGIASSNARTDKPSTPLTPGSLQFLAQHGFLESQNYEKALHYLGIRPTDRDWIIFWFRILLITGLLFFLAGVVCFFAWNWSQMSHFQKFAIIGGLMAVCAVCAVWRGPDSTPGGLALLGCGLLAGPLLAVYGQYYQTGADAWELFRAWTFFLALLALIGRQNGLWTAVWVTGSLWGGLYILQTSGWGWRSEYLLPRPVWAFISAQFLALILWEAAIFQARNRAGSFLHSAWLSRLIVFGLLVVLSFINSIHIVAPQDSLELFIGPPSFYAAMQALLLGAGYFWYRFKRPDPLCLTLGLISLAYLFFVLLYGTGDHLYNAFGMLVGALFMVGWGLMITKLVLKWRREILKDRAGKDGSIKINRSSLMFIRTKTPEALFRALNLQNADTATALLEENNSHLMPWYVRFMLAICAWVSALFLMGFLAFIIFETIGGDPDDMLFVFSVIFFGASIGFCKSKQFFAQQFALPLGITGLIGLCVWCFITFELGNWWELPIITASALCFAFIRQPTMRCIAFVLALFCCISLVGSFFSWTVAAFEGLLQSGGSRVWLLFLIPQAIISCLLFTSLAVFFVAAWENEKNWVQKAVRDTLFRPALYGIFLSFLLIGGTYATSGRVDAALKSLVHSPEIWISMFMYRWAGISCGLGLIFMAYGILPKGGGLTLQKAVIYICALVVTVAGWWLPWLPVAILMLAVSRYLGSMAAVGLTALFLTGCINWYYYSLRTSLLYKSYTLCAAGAVMLLMGFAIYRAFRELMAESGELDESDEPAWEDILGEAVDARAEEGSFVVTPEMLGQGGGHA